jgi:hypothetical protein
LNIFVGFVVEVEMKVTALLLSVLVLYSCSSTKKENKEELENGVPKWVYAPSEKCSKSREVCASGSGQDMEESDLNAKKSLASIFETKITSNFQVNTISISDAEKDELSERVYSEVEESIDLVLQAVTIKKRFQKDKQFYSLASLDKRKASKAIRLEMKNLDDQLDYLYSQKKRTSVKKMLYLFDKRQMLHERLILLDKGGMPSKYSFQQISNVRFSSGKNNISVKYGNAFPVSMKKWFENLMNDSGYKIVNGNNTHYQVLLNHVAKETYLKVSGFKKFQFTTSGEAKNNAGEKVGTFSVSLVSTGRTKVDAFQKIRKNLLNQIEQNLDKLNME